MVSTTRLLKLSWGLHFLNHLNIWAWTFGHWTWKTPTALRKFGKIRQRVHRSSATIFVYPRDYGTGTKKIISLPQNVSTHFINPKIESNIWQTVPWKGQFPEHEAEPQNLLVWPTAHRIVLLSETGTLGSILKTRIAVPCNLLI
jgi:hypothetical protein